MSAITDQAKNILDALKGSTFTPARALEIARAFTDDQTGTPDEVAEKFVDRLVEIVKSTVFVHTTTSLRQANQAIETQTGEDSVADL